MEVIQLKEEREERERMKKIEENEKSRKLGKRLNSIGKLISIYGLMYQLFDKTLFFLIIVLIGLALQAYSFSKMKY